MSATWMHMLMQIRPDYEKLKEAVDKGPIIKPMLELSNRRWTLTLHEVWSYDSSGSYKLTESSIVLDDIIEWTEKELTKWKDCRRTAWDMWQFKHKRDAEKFITLFHITWVQ
jgi:hypothetical protein